MNKKAARISYVSFLGLGVVYLGGSLRLPLGTLEAPRSGLFPLLVAILLIAVSFTLLLKGGGAAGSRPEEFDPFPEGGDLRRVAAVALTLFLYAAGLRFLGYLVCTTGLMASVVRLLGMKNWGSVAATAVLTGLISWGLFVFALDVPLPRGEVFP
jgi:hypothetical protein